MLSTIYPSRSEEANAPEEISLERNVASSNGSSISEDVLFSVLANQRRRFAVHILKRRDDPVELGTLATQIAAWEQDTDPVQVTGTERKRVYTALQQSHLPTMDDAGIVSFDKDRGLIEPTPALQDIEMYLDVVKGREIPWSQYYILLGVLGLAVMAGAGSGLWPFATLPDLAWGMFVVTALLVSSVAHWLHLRGRRLGGSEEPPEVDP